jgi:hypothetical protein
MDEDPTIEETTTSPSTKDQLAKMLLATAAAFIAGKVAEASYDTVMTKIREAKTKNND